jgi:hypothetical protein
MSSLFDLTCWEIEVCVANRIEHLVQRQIGSLDPVRIQFDPNLAVEAAPSVNLCDTGNAAGSMPWKVKLRSKLNY